MTDGLGVRDSNWVAEALNLDPQEAEGLMSRGDLPAFHIGSKWYVFEATLRQFLQEKEEQAAKGAKVRRDPTRARSGVSSTARRDRSRVTYQLLGETVGDVTSRAMLLHVLRTLADRDASFLPRFGQEAGRKRRYVAQTPAALYPGQPDLVRNASAELVDGWWVGTNYSAREIESILRKACRVAGLQWGRDFSLRQPDEEDRIRRAMSFVGIASDPDPDASLRHDEYFADSILDWEDDAG